MGDPFYLLNPSLRFRRWFVLLHARSIFRRTHSCIFVLLLGIWSSVGQPYVRIQARVESITHEMGTDDQVRFRRQFSVDCWLGTNEWAIRNNFVQGAEELWFFDGTNVLDSVCLTDEKPDPQTAAKLEQAGLKTGKPVKSTPNNTLYVQQSYNGHPLGNVGVNIPWLAFCSANYLSQPERLIPIPVATLRKEVAGFAYTDKTVRFDDGYGLPKTIDLYASIALLKSSVSLPHFQGSRDTAGYLNNRPAFQDGALKFHYVVMKETNFFDRTLPIEFSWFQNESTTDGKWCRRYSGTCTVTDISQGIMPDIFRTNMENMVIDYRLRLPSNTNVPLTYLATERKLTATNDSRLQTLLISKSEKLASASTFRAASSPSTWWRSKSAILFVMLLTTGVLVWVVRKTIN